MIPFFTLHILCKAAENKQDIILLIQEMQKMRKHSIIIPLILIVFFYYPGKKPARASSEIPELKKLAFHKNPFLKEMRNDVRRSIYIVRGRREASKLPPLKFYRYRVKSGDTFWKILSRSNLDMDTIMTVNDLSSPGQVCKGKILFLPNMRGILLKNRNKNDKLSFHKFGIPERYIEQANGNNIKEKPFLFIPCAKLSNLQRSLFLGTGFMSPVKYAKKTSGFGTRRDPFQRRRFQFHRGIDLACSIGTPVRAARSGIVSFRGNRGGYGKLLVIRHEHRYQSMYGHLSRYIVKPGQHVRAGEIIAYSGNTGRTTGPHLHFEVRRGKRAINPGVLLRR